MARVKLGAKESLRYGIKGKEGGIVNILHWGYTPKDAPETLAVERLKDMLKLGGTALESRLFALVAERRHFVDHYGGFSEVYKDGASLNVRPSCTEPFKYYGRTSDVVILDFRQQVRDNMFHLTPQYDTAKAGGVVAVLCEGDKAHEVMHHDQLLIPIGVGEARNIIVLIKHDQELGAKRSYSVWGFSVRRTADGVEVSPYDNKRRYEIDLTAVANEVAYYPDVFYSRAGR